MRDTAGRSSASSGTKRSGTALLVFLVVVILQISIPVAVLIAGPQRSAEKDEPLYRFGWQMFTGTEATVTYTLVGDDGTVAALADPSALIGDFWGHVQYGTASLRRLCDATDAAVVVRIIRPRSSGDEQTERYPCR